VVNGSLRRTFFDVFIRLFCCFYWSRILLVSGHSLYSAKVFRKGAIVRPQTLLAKRCSLRSLAGSERLRGDLGYSRDPCLCCPMEIVRWKARFLAIASTQTYESSRASPRDQCAQVGSYRCRGSGLPCENACNWHVENILSRVSA
jgi:hypothetical protein